MVSKIYPNAPLNAPSLEPFSQRMQEGLMKLSKFMVQFSAPRIMTRPIIKPIDDLNAEIKALSYLCEAAEWAGRSIMTSDVRYYGPSMKMPFQSTYNDLALTILCRDNMHEKIFFDWWQNSINPNNSFDFEYADNYTTQMTIFAFDEYGKARYKQTFHRTYPIIVQPIQTAWQLDQVTRLNVIFTYRYYSTEDDPPPEEYLRELVKGSTSIRWGGSYFLNMFRDRREDF